MKESIFSLTRVVKGCVKATLLLGMLLFAYSGVQAQEFVDGGLMPKAIAIADALDITDPAQPGDVSRDAVLNQLDNETNQWMIDLKQSQDQPPVEDAATYEYYNYVHWLVEQEYYRPEDALLLALHRIGREVEDFIPNHGLSQSDLVDLYNETVLMLTN